MKRIAVVCMLMALCHIDVSLAVGPGYLGDLGGRVVSIGNAFSSAAAGLLFSDLHTFDLGSPSQAAGATVSIILAIGGASSELGNMVMQMTDSASATVYDTDSQLDSGNTLSVNALLSGGSGYRFLVGGDVAGSLGGGIGGVLQAAPVPEADIWSMLLAGTALIALRMRSRNGAIRKIQD